MLEFKGYPKPGELEIRAACIKMIQACTNMVYKCVVTNTPVGCDGGWELNHGISLEHLKHPSTKILMTIRSVVKCYRQDTIRWLAARSIQQAPGHYATRHRTKENIEN